MEIILFCVFDGNGLNVDDTPIVSGQKTSLTELPNGNSYRAAMNSRRGFQAAR
jgi:hypothetical protein